jgi:hypothetical protein
MLVFSCYQSENREAYIETFNRISEYGEHWLLQTQSEGMNDEEVHGQLLPDDKSSESITTLKV